MLMTSTEQRSHQSRLEAVPFPEIEAERAAQDNQWGGPAHDDQHELSDWLTSGWGMDRFLQRAIDAAVCSEIAGTDEGCLERTIECEQALIKLAALAVAAVQSSRRKRA